MDRDDWVASAILDTDNGQKWLLRYYVHICAADGERRASPVYGLRVDKCLAGDGPLAETETTPAFTDRYDDAAALARLFAAGSVPPCVLLEMTDEQL